MLHIIRKSVTSLVLMLLLEIMLFTFKNIKHSFVLLLMYKLDVVVQSKKIHSTEYSTLIFTPPNILIHSVIFSNTSFNYPLCGVRIIGKMHIYRITVAI